MLTVSGGRATVTVAPTAQAAAIAAHPSRATVAAGHPGSVHGRRPPTQVVVGGSPPPGGTGATQYLAFVMPTPASTWLINHGFGRKPDVEVFVGGELVDCGRDDPDDNTTILSFLPVAAGEAVLTA